MFSVTHWSSGLLVCLALNMCGSVDYFKQMFENLVCGGLGGPAGESPES